MCVTHEQRPKSFYNMGCTPSTSEEKQPTVHHSRSSSLRRSQTFVNHQGLTLSRTPPGTGPRKPLDRSQSMRHHRNLTHCGVQVLPILINGNTMRLELPIVDDDELSIHIKRTLTAPPMSRERASTDERKQKKPIKQVHQRTTSFMEELDQVVLKLRQREAAKKSEQFQNKCKS